MKVLWRFQTRLLLIVVAASFVPLLLLTHFMFDRLMVRIEERTSALVRDGLERARIQIESLCLDMVKLTDIIRTDGEIQAVLADALDVPASRAGFSTRLAEGHLTARDYTILSRVENRIDFVKTTFFFNYDADILVFDEQGVVYNSSDNVEGYRLKLAYMAAYRGESWYRRLTEGGEAVAWTAPFGYEAARIDGPRFLSVARTVEDPRTDRRVGFVMANVSEANFRRIFKGSDSAATALLTASGGLVHMTEGGFDLSLAEQARRRIRGSGYTLIGSGSRKSLVVLLPVARFGWVLASILPYAQVVQDVTVLRAQVYGITAAGYALILVVTVLMVMQASRPLRKLVEKAGGIRVAGRGLEVALPPRERTDLLALSRTVEALVDRIRELAEEVVEERNRENRLRLEALQAQINPHFLFNALNAIKWTAHMSGADNVTGMISSLGAILEASMRLDRDEITLEAELALLRDFLLIENARRGDGVRLVEDIGESALGCLIVKLLLQPIVENAVRHARPVGDGPTEVRIAARLEDAVLTVTVSDNGVGSAGEPDPDRPDRGSGIGLSNVRERLRLRYGTELSIRCDGGRGTTVTVRIPETRP